MKTFLTIVIVAAAFAVFFRIQGAFIQWVLGRLTGFLVFYLVRGAVAVATGYMIYASIAIVGSADRMRTVQDVFTILGARPSQVGGVGVLGAVIGVIFGLFSFVHWTPYQNQGGIQQGRAVRFETYARQTTLIGSVRGFIQRNLRK